MSAKIAPLVILVTDSIGEGKLKMMTNFSKSAQRKVGPLDALSALVQCDSARPDVIVVIVFMNSPYLLWGIFGSP